VSLPGPGGAKVELRKAALAARNRLTVMERMAASSVIADLLAAHPAYKAAHTVMFYVSFGSEVATILPIKRALAEGKTVAVPLVREREGVLVASKLLDPAKDLAPGAYGIFEPMARAVRPLPPESLDLVVVPGVAFDAHGHRIGYGRGYYDRFLAGIGRKAITVAFAYESQIHDHVPSQEHDCHVQVILTEERVINC
jgi:5-formyltetrahydrofolate cyclo-ligase